MLYYHCSGSLQLLPPPDHPSDSLQELIKLERSHETSLRAWNQDFWAANVAMNSWALSEATDRKILETLTQISSLISKSVSAQNHYATALADYRACLKQTQDKEAELRVIKRNREILLKRFLKLNRRASVTPSNNLEFRIKLDDAKRELSICQTTLRAAADELHESKQNCLREALRAKLSKLEDFGHALKLNAQQAVQLLDQIMKEDPPSETESDFKSCDEDSIDEQTLLTPPLADHDHNSWPVRSNPQRTDAPNSFNIKSFQRTSVLGSQQEHPIERPSKFNHPAGLHIYSGSRHPGLSKKPIVPGTALMPPPRVLVRKRGSIHSRQSHLRSQTRTKQASPSFDTRSYHSNFHPGPSRTYARQRSQSLDHRPSIIIPRDASKPRKLVRRASQRSHPSQVSTNPSTIKSLGHIPSTTPQPRTDEQGGTFKFFPKGMISKLGAITKKKDEKTMSTKNQQCGDDRTEDVQSLQSAQERSFWPTIEPLSLYSDTCSDDSFSDDEQPGERFQSDDEIGGHEYPMRSTRTLRPGIHSTRGANQDSSPERVPKNNHRPKLVRRRSRPTSWNHIPKQTRRNNQIQRTKKSRANRKSRSTRSQQENSDSEDLSAQITLNEGLNETSAEESGSKNKEYAKTMEVLTKHSPLSRIQESDGSFLSEISGRKLGSPFDLERRHLITTDKTSIDSVVNEKQYDNSKQETQNFTQSSQQQQQEINEKSNNENFHQDHNSNHHLDDTHSEFKLQVDNTHKAMSDIKAKFFSLGMHPST